MDDYELAWGRLLELAVVLNEDMERSLANYGLTIARTHVLWVLHQQGPTTHKALAQAIGVSAQNVTGLVDALVVGGFVIREPHPSDRRATLVTLSERGRATTRAMEQQQRDLTHELFSPMPDDQFHCLLAGLGTVLRRIKELQAAADQSPAEVAGDRTAVSR